MIRKKAAVFFCFTIVCLQAISQKHTTHVQQFWVAYVNQVRISEKWGVWSEIHLRTREDFLSELSTVMARTAVTYYAFNDLRFTAGYLYANNFVDGGNKFVSQPEHRPWQQVQWLHNGPKHRLSHSLRLEERFRKRISVDGHREDAFNFNFRLRYNVLAMFPLNQRAFEPKTFSLAVNNEVMLNMGKQIVYNYFDQNRFFVGAAYHIDKNNMVHVGYLNVFQQLPEGNRYRSVHAPRIYYYQLFDLRKSKRR